MALCPPCSPRVFAAFALVAAACSIESGGLGATGDTGTASRDAGHRVEAGRMPDGGDAGRDEPDARLPEPTDAGRDARVEPDAGPWETHVRECESGTRIGATLIGTDALASGGAYTHVPSGSNWSASSTALPPDRVELPFTLGRPGPWYLWVRLYTIDGSHDAHYAGFDPGDLRRFWHLDFGRWEWTRGTHDDDTRLTFGSLGPGDHTLSIGPGETGPRCDLVVLTTDPDFSPSSVL
jgi:hypothetical protein